MVIIVVVGVIVNTPKDLSQAAPETLPGTLTYDFLLEYTQPVMTQTTEPTSMESIQTKEQTLAISVTTTPEHTITQPGYPLPSSKTPENTTAPIPTDTPPKAITATTKSKTPTKTQPQATASRTSTITPTRTQTHTPSLTATSAPQTSWEGEWIVAFEQTDGSSLSGTMMVNIIGSDLSASAELGGDQYSFEGFIYYQAGELATGTWNNSTTSGYFWWIIKEEGQFRGNRENHFAFCGARTGINLPEPCLQLPSR